MAGEWSSDKDTDDLNHKILGLQRSLAWGDHPDSLAPYVPSPQNIVKEMLLLAKTESEDVLYDLGCGDGRILFSAVEEFNVRQAVGYDLDLYMVETLLENIKKKGLENRIKVYCKNFMDTDLSPATVVTLYLTTSGNTKLRPKLEANLRQGARVVSHDFPIHGWVTDRDDGSPYNLGSHKIFLYKIPEAYHRDIKIERSNEEDDRWRRARDHFTNLDEV